MKEIGREEEKGGGKGEVGATTKETYQAGARAPLQSANASTDRNKNRLARALQCSKTAEMHPARTKEVVVDESESGGNEDDRSHILPELDGSCAINTNTKNC